jgi:anionic cell wall polymer biosynthesis LytR-Cps2A-Psr (LCP) family protein
MKLKVFLTIVIVTIIIILMLNFLYMKFFSPCKDSDNGKNYFKKGIVIFKDSPSEDYCMDEYVLRERFCKNNEVLEELYNCSNGCNEGACIK